MLRRNAPKGVKMGPGVKAVPVDISPAGPAAVDVDHQGHCPMDDQPAEPAIDEDQKPKVSRPKYTPAQLTAIFNEATGLADGGEVQYNADGTVRVIKGYKNIMKISAFVHQWGVKSEGVRSVIDRIKISKSLEDFLERKPGSGRKRWVRSESLKKTLQDVITERDNKVGYHELARIGDCSRRTAKRIVTEDLELKNVVQEKNQRISTKNVKSRLDKCQKWVAQMDASPPQFNPRHIFWTDEKIFRLGDLKGGSHNFRVLISNKITKAQCKTVDINRGDGAFMGGSRVMVCLGACYYGLCEPFFVPETQKYINAPYYQSVLQGHFSVEAAMLFREAGIDNFTFMQDGASPHTAKTTQALLPKLFPNHLKKTEWPSTSPDLNVLDFYLWGKLQRMVEEKHPKNLLDLKCAIKTCCGQLQLIDIQNAIDSFYKRCKLVIAQEGRSFRHMLKGREAKEMELPPWMTKHKAIEPEVPDEEWFDEACDDDDDEDGDGDDDDDDDDHQMHMVEEGES